MEFDEIEIREIEARDNLDVRDLIKKVMPEFGADGPGFAINDPEVERMHEAYSLPGSKYFVVTYKNRVLGGAGIAPLEGGDGKTCELRKMYFLPELRGKGVGQKLINICLEAAGALGFSHCYLETMEGMKNARKLYENNGFVKVCSPMGKTGHFGCDTWYIKDLY